MHVCACMAAYDVSVAVQVRQTTHKARGSWRRKTPVSQARAQLLHNNEEMAVIRGGEASTKRANAPPGTSGRRKKNRLNSCAHHNSCCKRVAAFRPARPPAGQIGAADIEHPIQVRPATWQAAAGLLEEPRGGASESRVRAPRKRLGGVTAKTCWPLAINPLR